MLELILILASKRNPSDTVTCDHLHADILEIESDFFL